MSYQAIARYLSSVRYGCTIVRDDLGAPRIRAIRNVIPLTPTNLGFPAESAPY